MQITFQLFSLFFFSLSLPACFQKCYFSFSCYHTKIERTVFLEEIFPQLCETTTYTNTLQSTIPCVFHVTHYWKENQK